MIAWYEEKLVWLYEHMDDPNAPRDRFFDPIDGDGLRWWARYVPGWIDPQWWSYYFSDKGDPEYEGRGLPVWATRFSLGRKLGRFICRWQGHPRGEIYYNHSWATEPDHRCKDCGQDLG